MIVQIKKRGDSKVIILPKDFLKYMDLDIGDYVNISDMIKVDKKENGK